VNELRAFAEGKWAEFGGLANCPLAAADAELGPPREDQLHGGMFGGEPTHFRRYPAAGAAPSGLTAWVLGEVVVGLEILEASPASSTLADLGPPEAEISSELGLAWSQQLWGSRGLVLHRRDDRIAVVFGLAPFTLDGWESDPLRWWRVERRTRRS
jgi:hypothetical protein